MKGHSVSCLFMGIFMKDKYRENAFFPEAGESKDISVLRHR